MTRILIAAFLGLALAGCATQPKRVEPFHGLLQAGVAPQPAPERPDPGLLRHQRLVIVASSNLEAYTKQWADYYERGGQQRQQQAFQTWASVLGQVQATQGMAQGLQQGSALVQQHGGVVRQASDPRNLTDAMTAMLAPYFASVSAAPDLASARDAGADYIAVVDYHGRWHPPGMATRYESKAGLYLLDADLRLALQVESYDDQDREGDGLLSMPAQIIAGTKTTLERGLLATATNLQRGLRAQLGPPPARSP